MDFERKMAFVNDTEQKLRGLSDTIEGYSEGLDKAAAESDTGYFHSISKMRAKLDAAHEWLEKVRAADDDEWDDAVEGMNQSVELLQNEIKRAGAPMKT